MGFSTLDPQDGRSRSKTRTCPCLTGVELFSNAQQKAPTNELQYIFQPRNFSMLFLPQSQGSAAWNSALSIHRMEEIDQMRIGIELFSNIKRKPQRMNDSIRSNHESFPCCFLSSRRVYLRVLEHSRSKNIDQEQRTSLLTDAEIFRNGQQKASKNKRRHTKQPRRFPVAFHSSSQGLSAWTSALSDRNFDDVD